MDLVEQDTAKTAFRLAAYHDLWGSLWKISEYVFAIVSALALFVPKPAVVVTAACLVFACRHISKLHQDQAMMWRVIKAIM